MRVAAGAVLIYHGWPKLFGEKEMMLGFFGQVFSFAPAFMLTLTGIIEVVGGALLILGLLTRYVSAVLILEFAYILLFVKSGWAARELDLLMFVIALNLGIMGAGSVSVDSMMPKKMAASAPQQPMA